MFAVPGWKLDPGALKAQTALPKNPITKEALPPAADEGEDGTEAASSWNRKRKHAATEDSVNLAELWEKVIEKKPKKAKKDKVGKRRKSKDGEVDPTVETGAGPTEVIEEQSSHRAKKLKTMKEKKREKKAARAAAADPSKPPTHTATAVTKSTPIPIQTAIPPKPKPTAQLTPLQIAMRQKLISARFRHLNQTLYTTPSDHSLSLFASNPEMFVEYHEGFRRQVEVWPENPVSSYITSILSRGALRRDMRGQKPLPLPPLPGGKDGEKEKPLPRTQGKCHIVDLGCGDAGLARGLVKDEKRLNVQIYSFDLQSESPLVTKADIAQLPLGDESVDVAVFCLALMGTNWIDFVEEAYRVLHWKGELWVAEIKSRFGRVIGKKAGRVEHSVGNRMKGKGMDKQEAKRREEEMEEKDLAVEVDGEVNGKQETDVSSFVEVLRKRGFVLQGDVDLRNRMFAKMLFVKGLTPVKGKCVPVPKGMEQMGVETWKKKPKFIDRQAEEPVSSEAGVLKPCVYKLR
ncbi:methyltransferase-domain-containing protein [Calycina marina]|uniref:Ribosomal RNA-processing protein 8 n=1 Tax=Calycina marina TaxID=1763456 RepID=A0A9P8CH47_9HELO|nr:methyltransferase-domain-containing protein [Calycina marina]